MSKPLFWHGFCISAVSMGRKMFISVLFLAGASTVLGQSPYMRRTPEETAEKQTEMLVRNLDITDSLTRDTLYRIHLHFALQRHPHPTPEEVAQYRDSLSQALRGILTPEQYQLFLDSRNKPNPRYPQPPVNRFALSPCDTCPPPPRAAGTPPPPPGYLL